MYQKTRQILKRGIHRVFSIAQKAGIDILPRHFYSSIPDIRALDSSISWRAPTTMVGVAGAECAHQLEFLRACCSNELREHLDHNDIYKAACAHNQEPGYGQIEAEFLYSFIVTQRPRRIIQVGAGVSTAVILLAAAHSGYQPELICIDPFPSSYLKTTSDRAIINLMINRAQDVELAALTDSLEGGDLLFVDSTHTVKPGSEVNQIILEVLPRLRHGVRVHFHDIYFPYDYNPAIMTELFFPSESTLLHAFLIGNSRCSIAVSLSMLHHACPGALQSMFPHYQPRDMNCGLYSGVGDNGHFPSSLILSVS